MDPVGEALNSFFARVQAFAGLFWEMLSDRVWTFWARLRAFIDLFFDEFLARFEGVGSSLSRALEETREVWPIFFDLLWQDLRAFNEQLQEWSIPFFDFLWQTLDGLWPGFAQVWDNIVTAFQSGDVAAYTSAAIKITVGLFLARIARGAVVRSLGARMSRQQMMVVRRLVSYSIIALFAISALRDLNVQLDVLLGAAGILTVALGFASQTSASNLISGLFLIAERAIEVGDIIDVEGTVGEVLTIDLLSSRLRTFDNLLVRIPNETMVKAKITNLSRLPIRRADIKIGVAYKEDLSKVRAVLNDLADKHPLCLQEPAPLFIFSGYGASSIDLQFSVWAVQANWLELRNSMQQQIKEAFDAEGIEIPFPHMTLYTGAITTPFPIQSVDRAGQQAAQEAGVVLPPGAEVLDEEMLREGAAATFGAGAPQQTDTAGATRTRTPAELAAMAAAQPPAEVVAEGETVAKDDLKDGSEDEDKVGETDEEKRRRHNRPLIVDPLAQGESDASLATGTQIGSEGEQAEESR